MKILYTVKRQGHMIGEEGDKEGMKNMSKDS